MRDADLDATDLKVLRFLQHHGRAQNTDIADHTGLVPSSCLRRVRKLEDAGVIAGYVALLEPGRVGLGTVIYPHVRLKEHARTLVERFERAVQEFPEVLECHNVLGQYDYILKVVVPDLEAYQRF